MMESGLNELVCSLVSAGSDTKKKLTVGQQIIDYLGAGNEVSGSDDVGTLVDTLVPWLNSSNFKVRTDYYHMPELSKCNTYLDWERRGSFINGLAKYVLLQHT